jgi:hypothetical protein
VSEEKNRVDEISAQVAAALGVAIARGVDKWLKEEIERVTVDWAQMLRELQEYAGRE